METEGQVEGLRGELGLGLTLSTCVFVDGIQRT